jgi:hypothetical protein
MYSRKGRWTSTFPFSSMTLVGVFDEISRKSTTGGGDSTDRAHDGGTGTHSGDVVFLN